MINSREYEIAWVGLKPGEHVFTYELSNAFMQAYNPPTDTSGWAPRVTLRFDKHAAFFQLHFDVGGIVTVPCDRCGDDFTLPLWDEFDLLVKFEEDAGPADAEADVAFIPRSETVLNVSDWLYEFATLSLPLQRIHPDRPDGTPACNPHALALLGKLSEDAVANDNTDGENDALRTGLADLRGRLAHPDDESAAIAPVSN